MKELNESMRKSIQEFKAYNLNKLIQFKKEQRKFIEEIRIEKSLEDLLTVKQVMEIFKISRKTFDRWRIDGLKIYQKTPNSTILVKRKDVFNFLNN